ncbi:MAG: hypothetical protein R2865_14195 [Deinococcales bacterium]
MTELWSLRETVASLQAQVARLESYGVGSANTGANSANAAEIQALKNSIALLQAQLAQQANQPSYNYSGDIAALRQSIGLIQDQLARIATGSQSGGSLSQSDLQQLQSSYAYLSSASLSRRAGQPYPRDRKTNRQWW